MFKNMVFKEMNKIEKIKEAALKELRELKKRNRNRIMQTKAWKFPNDPGGTLISLLAITCHRQHVKRLLSGLWTCCPCIPKKVQKSMIANCGDHCGHIGRGAVGYGVMT